MEKHLIFVISCTHVLGENRATVDIIFFAPFISLAFNFAWSRRDLLLSSHLTINLTFLAFDRRGWMGYCETFFPHLFRISLGTLRRWKTLLYWKSRHNFTYLLTIFLDFHGCYTTNFLVTTLEWSEKKINADIYQ